MSSAIEARNATGSVTAVRAASSNQARWLIWSRTAHPAAGVGSSQFSGRSGRSSRSSDSVSARRSARRSGIRFTPDTLTRTSFYKE
ncbi:hypothetical protein [Nonomuraea cavernae]|uniref:hypothetical protein n=1 Tax=Nonomuraea cavernae TaxID=2045107 RepID=UPI0027E45CB1|nr:hypothetical protein [Nonomuraea cavernae]